MRRSRFLLFVILIVIAIFAFLVIDGRMSDTKKAEMTPSSVGVIDEAFEVIKKKGVYPVESEKLIEGALRGMADVIGDPYSTYLSKEEAAAHKESLAGERVGIGAEITRTNGKFVIVAPIKASPADKAGLRPYDELVRINGERIDGDSLQQVIQRIRGKQGTSLTMTVYRPDENKHLELTVVRDVIPVKTVSSEMFEDAGRNVGYISITTFGDETAGEWEKATNKLILDGAQALIIDVRGNPGGYLHTVGDIAGSLLQENTVFAYMQDPDGTLIPLVVEASEKYKFNEKLKRMPIVLLQDKGSASASEVLSGALKDLRRGYITGTTSFGKGTVQDTTELSNGGEMKLSTHKWLTPKESWIHGVGVKADLVIEQDTLFDEHIRFITAEYNIGDFNDDVAYAQRMLEGLGYVVGREDGYYDDATARAVNGFRVDAKAGIENRMDRQFFAALKDTVEEYRKDRKNDEQLQMAIGYIFHQITAN